MALLIFLAVSLLLHGALGELVCENLPLDLCSYSIASSGDRCVLEKYITKDGKTEQQCKSSGIIVDVIQEYIETDECIKACGFDRNTIGISSDYLLQPQLLAKLCSQACFQSCTNIVDLYFNLALAEGTYLPNLCANPRRALYQTRSSGDAAPAPTSGVAALQTVPAPDSGKRDVASAPYAI